MPKLVDHDERRKRVALVAFDTMRRVGPERTTIREIARRGGFSHSLLSHYFKDSEEVFGFAYRFLTESSLARVESRTKRLKPGIQRLYAALDESCPYRLGIAAVATLSLWVHAVGNEHNRTMQKESYGLWRSCLRRYTKEAISAQHVSPELSPPELLDVTIMFLDGLCVAATLDPAHWTRRRQVGILNAFFGATYKPIGRWRAPPSRDPVEAPA